MDIELISRYKENVVKVVDTLNKAGENLFKKGKVLGYGAVTDRIYHTISNDPETEWSEYPVAHAFFKFGDNLNSNYIVLSARIRKEEKHHFNVSYQVLPNLPELGNYSLPKYPQKAVYYRERKYLEEMLIDLIEENRK
jgi:hypothetical protein